MLLIYPEVLAYCKLNNTSYEENSGSFVTAIGPADSGSDREREGAAYGQYQSDLHPPGAGYSEYPFWAGTGADYSVVKRLVRA
ncbi:hypothetical protein GCM10023187_09000 [Nibrella viscosa]|uniref:Uncharacterized protein n=1 Tax=Nibrella viscosa TaxID=1084524 RepID=A0ABP8K055_9BACT